MCFSEMRQTKHLRTILVAHQQTIIRNSRASNKGNTYIQHDGQACYNHDRGRALMCGARCAWPTTEHTHTTVALIRLNKNKSFTTSELYQGAWALIRCEPWVGHPMKRHGWWTMCTINKQHEITSSAAVCAPGLRHLVCERRLQCPNCDPCFGMAHHPRPQMFCRKGMV